MPNVKKKVTILGKRSVYSNAKARQFYFVSWSEPSQDPNEGSMGYIGVVDQEIYDSLKIGTQVPAYTVHNGSYHQILPL